MAMRPYENPHATFINGLLNYSFLIWALTVRALREASGGAMLGVLRGIVMAAAFCIAFYFVMNFFGLGGLTVRGDMMVFILIGVGFFFMMKFTMIAAMRAMQKKLGPVGASAPVASDLRLRGKPGGSLQLDDRDQRDLPGERADQGIV